MSKVEEKLYQNRYLVDEGRPHVKITPGKESSPSVKALVTACPAGCWNENETGAVEVVTDGCLECGTCRIICREGEIEWNYPRGGFGVLYKFG